MQKPASSNSGVIMSGISGLLLLFAAISYFTMGGLSGFFGVLILGSLFGFCVLLSFIPFGLGLVAQILLMLLVVQPYVFQLSGIHATGLTRALFWIDVAAGVIINIATSFIVVRWMRNSRL